MRVRTAAHPPAVRALQGPSHPPTNGRTRSPVLMFVSCLAGIVACGRREYPPIAAPLFRTCSQHRTEKTHQMLQSSPAGLVALLTTYGYWAVFAGIAIESTGIPFPGETMLLVASIYAGTTHQLAPVLVVIAAASGAILGDNLGFWVGRKGGSRLLRRNAHFVRRNERKLKLGLYLFRRHGGKVVFFGRFVAVLRMWAAFLAGTSRMAWPRFLLFNAASGILWACLVGLGGYFLGGTVHRLTGPVGIGGAVLAGILSIA